MSPLTSPFYLGLIGYPLDHSLSPRIHMAALQACGLVGDYSRFPIHPADAYSLKELLGRVRSGEIQGLNVTIPHKQNVIPYLDELTPTAEAIGAVNTIYLHENKLIGDNTDAPGFLADLKNFLAKSPSPAIGEETGKGRKSKIVDCKSSLILGAGGSARAVVYALLNDGWDVTLVARRVEQAQQLASSFPDFEIAIMSFESFSLNPSSFTLLVNTTPVGMIPDVDQSPWYTDLPFPPQAAVYDLVYNPRQTKLVKDARAQGLPATTGLGMLIAQAALSFEIWTGHQPPCEIMFEAVHQPTLRILKTGS